MPEIDKSKNKNRMLIIRIVLVFLIVCLIAVLVCLTVLGGFLIVNHVPSVKEALLLATTIEPEKLTELYFEDHQSLPNRVILFKENSFKFTIHNLENKDMEYPYEVYIDINGEKQIIDESSVLIKNNEYETITVDYTITIPVQRAKVVVNLIGKNQQIHFWIEEGPQT